MINGKLQPHQIDSLNWMISLYDLGLNGILADDMVRLPPLIQILGSRKNYSVNIDISISI